MSSRGTSPSRRPSSSSRRRSSSREMPKELPPFWDPVLVPKSDDDDFVRRTTYEVKSAEDGGGEDGPLTPSEYFCTRWHEAPNPKVPTSLGNNGVTASVNAAGDLVQFSTFLGIGVSGMYAASYQSLSEPYFVQSRAVELLATQRPALGVRWLHEEEWTKVALEGYHCDRWPVYSYSNRSLAASSTWMVNDGVVLNRLRISNLTDGQQQASFGISIDAQICELDHVNPGHLFNENGAEGHLAQPNDCGWIVSNKMVPSRNEEFGPGKEEKDDDPTSDVAMLVTVFRDGKPWQTNQSKDRGLIKMYSLQIEPGGRTPQIVVAYKLVRVPQSTGQQPNDWRHFIIHGEAADFDKHMQESEREYRYMSTSYLMKKKKDLQEQDQELNPELAEASAGTKEARHDHAMKPAAELRGLPLEGKSPAPQLDHVMRRNLEHILSVCAVPVPAKDGSVIVALTHGDLAGHRISSSASFFAFKFLIEMAKLLARPKNTRGEEDDGFHHLRSRIENVCVGHILWLREAQRMSNGCLSANYWVSGKLMKTGSPSFTPSDSHVDTALHLLKVASLGGRKEGEEVPPWFGIAYTMGSPLIESVALPWARALHQADKRKVCAWPVAKVEGSDKYRLSVHYWIWTAVRAMEMRLEELAGKKTSKSPGDADENDDDTIVKRLAPGNVQKEVLRRFTTGNDSLGVSLGVGLSNGGGGSGGSKRMLATTRSSRETRFLLHASDTALLYGMDDDFFLEDTPFHELWQNTLDAQLLHKEKYEGGWENLIRYALAVMMGTRGLRINNRSPKELVRVAMGVLLKATGPNCLFYGVIDATTKEIEVFQYEQDKDFFFHASFEIPYILLTHYDNISSAMEDSLAAGMSSERRPSVILTDPTKEQLRDLLDKVEEAEVQGQATTTQAAAAKTKTKSQKNPGLTVMKKSQPFNSLYDQTSIVELNEEWLYNYPCFLSRDSELEQGLFISEARKLAENHQERDEAGGSILVKAAAGFMGEFPVLVKKAEGFLPKGSLPEGGQFNDADRSHWIRSVDVPKQKRGRKRASLWLQPRHLHDFWDHLRSPRTAGKAKKRLIQFQRPTQKTALTCYIGSHEEERAAVALFFERYANFENYFFEDVTLALNEWDSELHLSFYQLEEDVKGAWTDLDNSKTDPSALAPEQPVPLLPGDNMNSLRIVRASMGFRFYGDFFDRHWTCYVVEHIQDMTRENMTQPIGSDNDLIQQQNCWQQRKVLELHLFDRTVKEIVRSTDRILTVVRTELGVDRGSFLSPILNSDDYFSSSARWQKSQQLLELIDEELSNVLTTITKWDAREKERGHERPRWTRNDERKYRLVIRKLEGTNRRRVRDLRKQHENLRLLKEMLIRSQAQIRDDLGLRGAENIRFFTYVTVVFLPLGFAASIFSMAEEPPVDKIVKDMVICAFIAVLVTILALANAKRLNAGLREVRNVIYVLFRPLTGAIRSFSTQSKRNSPLIEANSRQQTDKQRDAKDEEEGGAQTTATSSSPPRRQSTTTGMLLKSQTQQQQQRTPGAWKFWLTYLFLEFPARKVLRAFYTAKKPNFGRLSTYTALVWGVMLLPMLAITYPLRIALLNIADVIRMCWRFLTAKMTFPDDDFKEDQDFKERLSRWVHLPPNYRPLRDGRPSSPKPRPESSRPSTANRHEKPPVETEKGPEATVDTV